jgi:hypothetical protein
MAAQDARADLDVMLDALARECGTSVALMMMMA